MYLYAEVYNGVSWEATGGNLHGRTNRGLHELLSGSIYTNDCKKREYFYSKYLKYIRSKRLFPRDTSDKILDNFFYGAGSEIHAHDLFDDNWNEIYTRQVVRQILTQQGVGKGKDVVIDRQVGWADLEELNNFDWNRLDWDYPYRYYGEVPIEYAELFGSGEQPWPKVLADDYRSNEGNSLPLCTFHYPLHIKAPIPNEYVCEDSFTLVSWLARSTYSYKFDCSIFRDETLPLLRTYGVPKDIRLIFWVNG